MMKQELPPYGQPGGYQQQQPAQYTVQVPNGGQPANEVQHHEEPPPPRSGGGRHGCAGGDDSDDEGGDKDVLGPGELPDRALNVSISLVAIYFSETTKIVPVRVPNREIWHKYGGEYGK